MDMNQYRKHLAKSSKKSLTEAPKIDGKSNQLDEAMAKHESKVWAAMESLSQAIGALFEYSKTAGVSKEANAAARALANDLAHRYDQIQISVDKNIRKLK
jgi:hypothetical protein